MQTYRRENVNQAVPAGQPLGEVAGGTAHLPGFDGRGSAVDWSDGRLPVQAPDIPAAPADDGPYIEYGELLFGMGMGIC